MEREELANKKENKRVHTSTYKCIPLNMHVHVFLCLWPYKGRNSVLLWQNNPPTSMGPLFPASQGFHASEGEELDGEMEG